MTENTDQDLLNKPIGNKDPVSLKPAKVVIKRQEIKAVGTKGAKKVVCWVKHPDKEDLVQISSVKVERKTKTEFVGLFINLDDDGMLGKNSGLAIAMRFVGAQTPAGLVGKEFETVQDEAGYLAFKAY